MKTNRLFLDIHAIQSVPPSNVNRDDTGTPKTAQYGGATRSRVSSQSWKRAMRKYFSENQDKEEIKGYRSLQIPELIAEEILKKSNTISKEEALEKAVTVLSDAGIKPNDTKLKALFFISSAQASKLAEAAIEGIKDKNTLQEILTKNASIDIALFGRMVADDPTLNEDASSQVAHSISTHAVQTEFDFFTATDDLKKDGTSGAGMLGTVEFNSSTLYRYANIAVHEFFLQLGNDAEKTAKAAGLFIEAFLKSMPTGKINTFANQTLPTAVIVTIRKDRPVNLVTAFEKPVVSSEGYNTESAMKLEEEFSKVLKFTEEPILTLSLGETHVGEEMADFSELLRKTVNGLTEKLQ